MTTTQVEREQRLLIDGEWVHAAGERAHAAVDPYTQEPVTRAAAAGPDDVRHAVEAAEAACPAWRDTPPGRRRDVLWAAAANLQENAEAIAATMTDECGATFGWGMFNVDLAARMLREAGAQAYATGGAVIPSDVPGLHSTAVRQPVGVVVGIAPWNAPVILSTRAVAAPLAYGNAVILKASEQCPCTHAAVVAALDDAGVPPGVVGFLANDPADAPAVVEQLIAHPAVKRINFTGSTRVGRIIAAHAAAHLKRTLLELGGKAPLVVLADADLDDAAAAASFGAFMNSGQICMSTERVIAEQPIADELGRRLAARADALVVGDPRDPGTQVGPVISTRARDRILALIEDATAKGARVLAGGEADGTCVRPTVLAGVTREMDIDAEESFGPVLTITAVADADEAVDVANDTEYGLAAAVFGRDVQAATAVAHRIESGICHVNSATVHDEPQVPFGGVKASGWGRFGGAAALDEFTELRWLTVQGGSRHYPI